MFWEEDFVVVVWSYDCEVVVCYLHVGRVVGGLYDVVVWENLFDCEVAGFIDDFG